jgi:acetylornithine/N-succinyldiaminopimelate aminotransferase
MSNDDRSYLMGTYAPPPVVFVEGRGSELFDTAGKRYLDFIGGLAVTSLGHAHPVVAAALSEQADRLWHTSNLYANDLAPQVAATLDRLMGGGDQQAGGQVFFANSGAEANECAIKLARRWTGDGRFAVVSALGSFHGRTLAALAATGQPAKHVPFEPLPDGFSSVPYDNLDELAKAVEATRAAAVLLEPIQGEGGVVVPSSDYLAGVRQICDDNDALLMLDEVQTGLGRTGRWFAHQAQNLQPDIVTMAKALGNGMPVGACWARAEVAAAFGVGDHATTFGGQPLALSAVAATLSVMEAEDVCGRAVRQGARLRAGLEAIDQVQTVRGAGLLLAAELHEESAAWASQRALDRGLLVNPVRPDALRFAPSLLVSDAEIDEAVGIVAEVLAETPKADDR